jgi:hypothetical protein
MPRAKAKFSTGSPKATAWPGDPVRAMQVIASKTNATYIDGSLIFTPGGQFAEALFETVEPGESAPPTMLHQLGRYLDAIELTLYFDPDTWQRHQREPLIPL